MDAYVHLVYVRTGLSGPPHSYSKQEVPIGFKKPKSHRLILFATTTILALPPFY